MDVILKRIKVSAFLLLLMQSCLVQANNRDLIVSGVNSLKKSGQLESAYKMSCLHQDSYDIMALQCAQLTLLMGKEEQAMALFSALNKSRVLSDLHKKNVHIFLTKFYLSINARLKQANVFEKNRRCDAAVPLYSSVIPYKKTRVSANKGLIRCGFKNNNERAEKTKVSGYIIYGIGNDSNLDPVNFEQSSGVMAIPESTHNEGFQRFRFLIKQTVSKNTNLWLQPQYSLSYRDYFTDKFNSFDQVSNNIKLNIGGRINTDYKWRTPFFYKNIRLNNRNYLNYTGVNPSVTIQDSGSKQTFSYLHQQKRYSHKINTDSNADINQISFLQAYNDKSYLFQGKASYRVNEVNLNKSSGYNRYTLGTRIQRRLESPIAFSSWKSALYSRLSIAVYEYAERDPDLVTLYGAAYDKVRQEARYNFAVGVKSKSNGVQLQASILLQYRESNLPIYQYSKNIFEIELRYRF